MVVNHNFSLASANILIALLLGKKEVFLRVGRTQGEKVKGQRPMVCRGPIILFCNKVHL